MKNLKASRTVVTATLAVVSLTLAAATVSANAASGVGSACAVTKNPRIATCLVLIRTGIKERTESFFGGKAPTGFGYGPSDLVRAYHLPSSTVVRSVAVVDAYSDPDAAANLATYRSAWKLPKCDTSTKAGCLTVTNQFGATGHLPKKAGTTGWATEESLDVDMVSAICPTCHIFLVEANSPNLTDLGTAVNSAIKVLGAHYVSNSYGAPESSAETGYDTKYYKHAGVAVTAAAGNGGFGVSYPAASEWVTAVGGTTLTHSRGTRGWTETVWGSTTGGAGTGSGCSKFEPRPAVQKRKGWPTGGLCKRRIDNDVSAVADPATGVAIYDTADQHGWLEVGGTGVSSPIIAAVFALAGQPAAGTFPSAYPYGDASELNDVTKGVNGSCLTSFLCRAGTRFDGPTGCGTPNGVSAFRVPHVLARPRSRLTATGRAARRDPAMTGPPC